MQFAARLRSVVLSGVVAVFAIVAASGVPVVAAEEAAPRATLWVARSNSEIVKLDSTGRVLARIDACCEPRVVATGAGAVWVSTDEQRVLRVDPNKNRVDASVTVGTSVGVLAPTGAAVWVTAPQEHGVVRIDPAANTVVARIPVGTETACPSSLTADATSVWVVLYTLGVARIDAATNEVAAQTPGSQASACQPASVALAGRRLWSLDAMTGALFGLDPTTLTTVTTRQLGSGLWQIAGDGTALWALDQSRGRLLRIEPTDGSIIERISARSRQARQLVLGAESVWFYDGKAIVRVPYQSGASRTRVKVSKVNGFAVAT
jgi:hypothetical protein